MAVVAILLSSATAIKFRPIPGTVPWHNGPDSPEWIDPKDHDVNYGVPNFGADSEINASMKNMEASEKLLSHVMHASFSDPDGPPRNYFVPNFGEDSEISSTKKNIAYAEAYHHHEYDTSPPPGAPPRDYFVPHFGEDDDIKSTKSIISATEQKLNHKLDTSPPPADPPRNYFVPHFGEDEDIAFSKKNIAGAEARYGAWNVKRDGNGAWVLPGVEENKFGNFKAENNWPSD